MHDFYHHATVSTQLACDCYWSMLLEYVIVEYVIGVCDCYWSMLHLNSSLSFTDPYSFVEYYA